MSIYDYPQSHNRSCLIGIFALFAFCLLIYVGLFDAGLTPFILPWIKAMRRDFWNATEAWKEFWLGTDYLLVLIDQL